MFDNEYSVVKKFSKHPAGRFYSDGEYSGERFREEVLIPIIKSKQKTKIIFDGARGAGSSFLDEAFGGLVRKGYGYEEIKSYIEVESKGTTIAEEVEQYLKDAAEVLKGDKL